ncbi:MAG: sulfatase-like hydrolase/transferase [Akkermansiaceae bacterium]
MSPAVAKNPNVIVMISDDAGWADWGFMNPHTGATTNIPTPELDNLRSQGTLFTSAYTGAVCSPSRGAITTGVYQNKIGYEYNINNLTGAGTRDGHFNSTELMFEHMKTLGHTTGAIGKWHIGSGADTSPTILGNRPERQGVDEFFGIWKGSRNYAVGGVSGTGTLRETKIDSQGVVTDQVLENTAPWNGANVTNVFGQGAVDFIARHHDDTEPFFLYVAFTAPHGPLHNSPDINDPSIAGLSGNRKKYASMMLTMDKEVGRIMDRLEDPDNDGNSADSIRENTLVIFINDNGGEKGNSSVNLPLQGHKGSPWEGGIRVPMIMAGPGVPVNGTYARPVHSIDIVPTAQAVAGGAPIAGLDGVNLLPYMNGTATGDPHESICVRKADSVGLRKGDWKLVKTGANAGFALYDLSVDIGEANDLSSTHPAKLEELKRELTAYEVTWEKPRHASLGQGANTINQNNKFIASPPAPSGSTFTANLTIIGGSTKNGNFNAGGGTGVQTYAQTPDWSNLGTGTSSDNATNTNSDDDGSRNAIIAENSTRAFGSNTGHTLAAGEVFQASYRWRNASNWGGNDKIAVTLFVTDDNTLTGAQTIIASRSSSTNSSGSYKNETHLFDPTPASFAGKILFVKIDAAQSGSGFARLDQFQLARGTVGSGSGSASFNWSANNAWKDADTSNNDTLLIGDSFASAALVFPSRSYNYTATNNMQRFSGLEFMLGNMEFTGSDSSSVAIDGNAVLFANLLDGAPPEILNTSNNGMITIDHDIVLYHDLNINGDGSSPLTVNGEVSEYLTWRSLTKKGSSTFVFSTAPSYTGATIIENGTLAMDAGVDLASTSGLTVAPAGTLAGNGSVSCAVVASGEVAPGQNGIGTLTITELALSGTLKIEVNGASIDSLSTTGLLNLTGATLDVMDLGGGLVNGPNIIASYGSRTGVFSSVIGVPAGYFVNYQYNDGSGVSKIAIMPDTAYRIWITGFGETGAESLFTADADNDGLANGLEFLTGGSAAAHDGKVVAVTLSDTHFTVDYPLDASATGVKGTIEVSANLTDWEDLVHGEDGVVVTTDENHYGAGIDRVRVQANRAGASPVFVRLKAEEFDTP